jgi:hypothetical protein
MKHHERTPLLIYLRSMQPDDRRKNMHEATAADRQRKKIIAMMREIGYEYRNQPHEGAKADMVRIKEWVLKYGYLKKDLNSYTVQELPKLVSQVQQYHSSERRRKQSNTPIHTLS